MKVRTGSFISLSSAAVLLLASTQVSAARGDAQLDACIEAFVAAHLPKDRAVKVRKVDTTSPRYAQARSERITLTAKGARSGTEIASATCVVEEDGVSLSLHEAAPGKLAHNVAP